MQKQKLRNNKIKGRNTKNMPMFILIGLIAMIIIIAVIYYVFLRYSPEQIITYSGYAIEGKTMAENLKSSEISNIEQYLNLVEVKENDLLYKRLNSYYIGEDDKKEVDINYPMYINEGNTVWNLSQNTKLITVNYEEVEGYPEFMLTGGVMYNGGDLTRADGNQYLFIKSEDDIYINVQKINIQTASNEYEIKEYSNIYFTEDAITYYEMQDGYMQYKKITDIDNNSEITIKGETLTYKTFLEKLGVIQSEEQNVNNNQDEEVNEIEETNIVNNETQTEEENNNITNETTNEWQEGMWAKPEVSCTDFEADVYTIRANLSVIDRAGVITRGVIFEISLDGRLNRRVQATTTGKLEITGLQPDTTYEIVGIVYYNDENANEVEEEFYTGSVTTKLIDILGTIDFSFENGEIYSNKIELIHLKINNDINEEVVKGISRLQLEIDGIEYRLSNDQVDQVKAGEEITYQTSATIDSNSRIKYEITAFDKFGNELKEINNTGETITSRQAPSASIRATKQDVTEVNLEVSLTNKDNVSLENYRYEIINQSRDVVKNGTLNENSSSETLVFTDLDPNGYYQIIIYGDYDLENGAGKQVNQELGRGSFVTRPIASLGYMQVRIEDTEVTQNEMTLGISIDSNQTDARLIAILDKVEVVIYDEGKNINQDNSETEEQTDNEIKRITLTSEEVELLKIAEEVELNLDQLTSNTKYKIDVITTVKQGSVEEVVEDKQNIDQVITIKMPAEVQIRNQFVIGDMIDLDIRVEDADNAVLTQEVRIEVRDEDNKLVDLSEMATNGEYERKTYENLEENTTYRIIIYAPQYNEGSTDETYHADYILKEIKILTEAGISGKLDLLSLEKTPSGKNLVDVASKVNWYERCFNSSSVYGINYDEGTKILTLGGTNSYLKFTYYNLSKYKGQEVTISFKARTSDSTNLQIVEKTNDDFNDSSRTTYYTINDLTNDWKEYSYTVIIDKTGYIGFATSTEYAKVEMQDLQIELGNTKTNYEDFEYIYNANLEISINDARDEITTNDYYIRIYKDNEQIQEIRYEEIGEDNKIENVEKTFGLDSDSTYKMELLVKIADRYYELDSQEFTTEDEREIRGISNLNDLLKIQPYGEYIVLNDVDLTGASGNEYKFGNENLQFEGKINFNGKTLTKDIKNNESSVFDSVGKNGIIENIVLNVKLNNETESSYYGLLAGINYGTIRNVMLNVIESNIKNNGYLFIMTELNNGTIENFVINFMHPVYVINSFGSVAQMNSGIIKNGYIYGQNIKILGNISASVGGVAQYNQQNGIIENVFSLVNVDSETNNKSKGNITATNINNASIQNVYSVGIGENTDLNNGPNIYSKTSLKVINNYYFTDEIFESLYEIKGNKLSLWDSEFQNQIINTDGAFIVDELVNEGYYPHVDMPNVMPLQEYIELPEVEDADLPDILSTKILDQGTNSVKVEFSVNNPSAETISKIDIENLDVEILSQEYKDGKSTIEAELKNPVICVSSYNVLSISTRGAFSSTYTRTYEEGERVISVDLYNEIWNINDWKNIKNSPTENYLLMENLDFINEGNTVSISNINGKINGNGHSLSNINLTNNYSLITNLNGTIENLYINNFNQEVTTVGGVISTVYSGASIDGVHLNNARITKNGGGYLGGLVRYASMVTAVKNSSVTNCNIYIYTEESVSQIGVGGLIGFIDSVNIENCFVEELNIYDNSKAVSSAIGGIVGDCSNYNRIINCYADGILVSNNLSVGGIVGSLAMGIVENCYSTVNISTTNNYVGGIIGRYYGLDITNIKNNVSIGDIYTTSGIDNLNRIVGNNIDVTTDNYAYEKQLLQGYVNKESKGAILLSKEKVLSFNLGNSYDYSGRENGILPKLYNTEGTELLPNQEDIYLEDNKDEEKIDLEIESIEATKPNTTEAEINIRINNPEKVDITEITIEDIYSTITRNVTQNGITNITLRATPERYYDSYKLTKIKYKINDSAEQIKEVEAEVKVQFYKEIYTFEDWQSIEEGTYQNYKLMADIDFSGRDNINSNITLNRLEAENQIYTLKNFTLEFNATNAGLIQNVKTSIKNIRFENITLKNSINSGSYFGIIANSNGDLENLQFDEIYIEAPKMNYVGILGNYGGASIKNIEIDHSEIKGNSNVGFIGYYEGKIDTKIENISEYNVIVMGGDYVGLIFGRNNGLTTGAAETVVSGVTIEESRAEGNQYVGGVTGYSYAGYFSNIKVVNTTVKGYMNAGGVAGYADYGGLTEVRLTDSDVETYDGYVGGIAGEACFPDSGSLKKIIVEKSYIASLNSDAVYTGGIFGYATNTYHSGIGVLQTDIYSYGSKVGGFIGGNDSGGRYYLQEGIIEKTSVIGRNCVGGVIGENYQLNVNNVMINVEVYASEYSAGGVIGKLENMNTTNSLDKRNDLFLHYSRFNSNSSN